MNETTCMQSVIADTFRIHGQQSDPPVLTLEEIYMGLLERGISDDNQNQPIRPASGSEETENAQ